MKLLGYSVHPSVVSDHWSPSSPLSPLSRYSPWSPWLPCSGQPFSFRGPSVSPFRVLFNVVSLGCAYRPKRISAYEDENEWLTLIGILNDSDGDHLDLVHHHHHDLPLDLCCCLSLPLLPAVMVTRQMGLRWCRTRLNNKPNELSLYLGVC